MKCLRKAFFIDVFGNANDSSGLKLETKKNTDYGTLDIGIEMQAAQNGILQIRNKKGDIVEEVYMVGKAKHFFPFMDPGEYFLKFIQDDNGNEKWDSGKYLDKLHAERVFIYPGSITIRSNWDQVIEWKINE